MKQSRICLYIALTLCSLSIHTIHTAWYDGIVTVWNNCKSWIIPSSTPTPAQHLNLVINQLKPFTQDALRVATDTLDRTAFEQKYIKLIEALTAVNEDAHMPAPLPMLKHLVWQELIASDAALQTLSISPEVWREIAQRNTSLKFLAKITEPTAVRQIIISARTRAQLKKKNKNADAFQQMLRYTITRQLREYYLRRFKTQINSFAQAALAQNSTLTTQLAWITTELPSYTLYPSAVKNKKT